MCTLFYRYVLKIFPYLAFLEIADSRPIKLLQVKLTKTVFFLSYVLLLLLETHLQLCPVSFSGTSSCSRCIGNNELDNILSYVVQFVDVSEAVLMITFIAMPPVLKDKALQPVFSVGIQFPHLVFTWFKKKDEDSSCT